MLDLYANQNIPWKKRTGTKPNGQPEFAPVQIIKGRFEYSRKLVRNMKGEQVVSQAFVMTGAPVGLGDVLTWDGRDWTVLTLSVQYGLMGEELHREVRL